MGDYYPERKWIKKRPATTFKNAGVAPFSHAVPRYCFMARRLHAAPPNGAGVLSVGAGGGKIGRMLKEGGFQVNALDPGEAGLKRLRSYGIDGRVGSAEGMPFERGYFDGVVASDVVEHLDPTQRELAPGEILRLLRGGVLFLSTLPFSEQLEGSQTVCADCGYRSSAGVIDRLFIARASTVCWVLALALARCRRARCLLAGRYSSPL